MERVKSQTAIEEYQALIIGVCVAVPVLIAIVTLAVVCARKKNSSTPQPSKIVFQTMVDNVWYPSISDFEYDPKWNVPRDK